MAKRDQVRRALGAHDAGEPRDREHVALLDAALLNERERRGLHDDRALGGCHPFSLRLVGDVDHAGLALFVEMRELRHRCYSAAAAGACRPSKVRVASVTSAWRIKDSPTRKMEAPTRCSRSRSDVE